MTTTAELSQDEAFMESIEPPSSDDLFGVGGDILGDELMDIYNAAVVGGSEDDGEVMNGMYLPGYKFRVCFDDDDKKSNYLFRSLDI